MEIRDTGLPKPVIKDDLVGTKAAFADGSFSSAQQIELDDYRAKDPRLRIENLEQELIEAKGHYDAVNASEVSIFPWSSDKKNEGTLSDKQVKKFTPNEKIWRTIDGIASNTAIISNVTGGFLQLMNLPEKAKANIAKFVDLVTNFSFIPYGLDGMKKAYYENKNPYMFLGFAMELSMVWMSDLKNKYLIRGAATGTDQIWVATKHKLMDKDPERFQNGKFKTWSDGLIETPKACLAMLKDIVRNPSKALATIDKEKGTGGYYALISSIGSFASTVGYFMTRNEKVFGTMRDISGCLFDWEMLLAKNLKEKVSGICFIAESVLDFTAKFIDDNSTRLFVNMLSHASGRQALQLYKASNEDDEPTKPVNLQANQDKRQSTTVLDLHSLAV